MVSDVCVRTAADRFGSFRIVPGQSPPAIIAALGLVGWGGGGPLPILLNASPRVGVKNPPHLKPQKDRMRGGG